MAANTSGPRPVRAGRPHAGGGEQRSGKAAAISFSGNPYGLRPDPIVTNWRGESVTLTQALFDEAIYLFGIADNPAYAVTLADPTPQRPAASSQPPDPDSDDTEP